MSKKTKVPIIGTKSSLLWDEDTDAWVYISGQPERGEDPSIYYKIIPTLFRAVDLRAKAIASLPWSLMMGDEEFETSRNYQNKTGLVDNMNAMLWLIEASLTLAGAAYWKREKNPAGYDKLRHLNPASMVLDEEKAVNGELAWKRHEKSGEKVYTPKDIIYLWYPDPHVEIGPPSSWPAKVSLFACGVLANMDEFIRAYFGRGAVKATIFAMQGASRSDAEAFESWWNKFIGGIKNAFRTKVVNAEKVEPVVVGEGVKELENVTLSQEKREEIAVAMDIKFSILFSNAANYATAERDKLNWYEDFVVPEAEFIAAELNKQLFGPLWLTLVFKPETLDIFQEDEEQRAGAMTVFMDAIIKAETLEMAQALFIIYGIEVSDEAMALIEQYYNKKQNEMVTQPIQLSQPQPSNGRATSGLSGRDQSEALGRELSIWQSKCLSALKRGDPAASVSFVPVLIPPEQYTSITARLKFAETAEAVQSAFVGLTWTNPAGAIQLGESGDSLAQLAHELRRANDLLEATR